MKLDGSTMKRTSEGDISPTDDEGGYSDLPVPKRSRLGWWLGGLAVVAVGAVAAVMLLGNDSGSGLVTHRYARLYPTPDHG